MSGLNDETLHRVLQQIQLQLVRSRKELSLVQAQIAAKDKERRILSLTKREIGAVPEKEESGEEVRMYKGVGKMFMLQPRPEIVSEQAKLDAALADELANLTKKAKYLQKQFDDADGQMKDIFHAQTRQQQQQQQQ